MHMDSLQPLIRLDRSAVNGSLAPFEAWDPASIDRPTPCAGWSVGALLAHMTVQQHGFSRAVAGERTELSDWTAIVEDDPVGAYRKSCDEVLAAFAGLRDPSAPVLLPEVRPEPLPTMVAVGFHLVDNVVHAWDAARALGRQVDFDDSVLAAALDVSRLVPDDERRDRDGAAFAHSLPVPTGTSKLDEILLLLGRDPGWTPAA
jgi:uncharacterized protein (TIGR03086 family)